jgi:hypothetical protein
MGPLWPAIAMRGHGGSQLYANKQALLINSICAGSSDLGRFTTTSAVISRKG